MERILDDFVEENVDVLAEMTWALDRLILLLHRPSIDGPASLHPLLSLHCPLSHAASHHYQLCVSVFLFVKKTFI